MNIRGIQKFSLVDFPGRIGCVVFVGGCNFRCPYCHNPALVFDPESQPLITEEQIYAFLETRKGKLDGVVISGGEPSLRPGLPEFARRVKEMGFAVKIDTNGSQPETIIAIHQAGHLDALGIDYKAPAADYGRVANCQLPELGERVQRLIKYAVDHGIPTDIRTTVHRAMLPPEHLKQMRAELDALGVVQWTLQQFHPVEIVDDQLLMEETYSDGELFQLSKTLGGVTKVRGLKGIYMT